MTSLPYPAARGALACRSSSVPVRAKSAGVILIGAALFGCVPARANERALAPCPIKTLEAVVTNADKPSEAEVVFRNASSRKQIGTVGLGGYSAEAEILWSPDGKFAALARHSTRHTAETLIFRVTENAIQQVKVQDYAQNIYGRLNLLHGGRGFVDKPLKWLASDRLLISAMGTLDREDEGYHYEVEIRIVPDADQFVGWLEKISPVKSND